jgi:hypothetical protein
MTTRAHAAYDGKNNTVQQVIVVMSEPVASIIMEKERMTQKDITLE